MEKNFKQVLGSLKVNDSGTVRIACKGEQRTLVEKRISVIAKFPFVDKRKYATTYYLPSGAKIIILNEILLVPLFKSPIDFDIRKWPDDKVEEFFKVR